MMIKKFAGAVLAGAAVVGLALSSTAAMADKGGGNKNRVFERCRAFADAAGKMDARWEVKKAGQSKERKRFSLSFEASAASGIPAGATLTVAVSTVDPNDPTARIWVDVGSMVLKDGGDDDTLPEGKLRFDSKPHSSQHHPWQPFPAAWPTDVADGTGVAIRNAGADILSCDMH